ncbi:phosphodiester glycosidase family protein [Mucisphaera calidilacus]|uniref:Phosphodiester glycosidase domain-containing protein n=1 Tax=Mucisphaera calidilacus TaxID=2527982 RepID=A0A518C0L9_9BACT|nr:phosphodiester glycosidase family protein [Mucisphaera calidilacus]QDU72778.1 hypothetical protein Pan265_26520 [Mucisphaera calidilacus]
MRFPALPLLAAILCSAPAPAALIQSAEPFLGITHHQIIEANDGSTAGGTINFPRPVVVHLVEIDPTAPGLAFFMQPGNGSLPGETARTTTPNFVNQYDLQLAINGDFYFDAGAGQAGVVHTAVSNGNGYSTNYYRGQAIFNVDAFNNASILTAASAGTFDTIENTPLYNAIGGNQRILTNGNITAPNDSYTNALNPHTAIGVDDNGHVFFMTVDGRQSDFSSGMRTSEMAELFLQFGVTNAINVDGGGSTTLAFDDSDDGINNARVVNSPSDGSQVLKPGYPRTVANNLGVYATPNPDYIPLPTPPRPTAPGAVPVVTQLTILDDFEGSKGHFTATRGIVGTGNVATYNASNSDLDPHTGYENLQIDITNTNDPPPQFNLVMRSGNGFPSNNLIDGKAMGNTGYVGFFLKIDPSQHDLNVTITLHDGSTQLSTLKTALPIDVIADGQWHLYQWNLADDNLWSAGTGYDPNITGPNTFINAITLHSDTNWEGSIHLDTVAYNPDGDLSSLIIPEPATLTLLALAATTLSRRRPAA